MKQADWEFYKHIWQNDKALHSCSLEAKGLFAQLLCLMHEAAPYGYLALQNGLPLDTNRLARITGTSARKLWRLITELEKSGVLSRNSQEQLFSVQMKRRYS